MINELPSETEKDKGLFVPRVDCGYDVFDSKPLLTMNYQDAKRELLMSGRLMPTPEKTARLLREGVLDILYQPKSNSGFSSVFRAMNSFGLWMARMNYFTRDGVYSVKDDLPSVNQNGIREINRRLENGRQIGLGVIESPDEEVRFVPYSDYQDNGVSFEESSLALAIFGVQGVGDLLGLVKDPRNAFSNIDIHLPLRATRGAFPSFIDSSSRDGTYRLHTGPVFDSRKFSAFGYADIRNPED